MIQKPTSTRRLSSWYDSRTFPFKPSMTGHIRSVRAHLSPYSFLPGTSPSLDPSPLCVAFPLSSLCLRSSPLYIASCTSSALPLNLLLFLLLPLPLFIRTIFIHSLFVPYSSSSPPELLSPWCKTTSIFYNRRCALRGAREWYWGPSRTQRPKDHWLRFVSWWSCVRWATLR